MAAFAASGAIRSTFVASKRVLRLPLAFAFGLLAVPGDALPDTCCASTVSSRRCTRALPRRPGLPLAGVEIINSRSTDVVAGLLTSLSTLELRSLPAIATFVRRLAEPRRHGKTPSVSVTEVKLRRFGERVHVVAVLLLQLRVRVVAVIIQQLRE